jgi:hypothetical protein
MKRPLPATDSPSRRSVLTALAAVPVAGVPAVAGVANASEPDPIFALIDAARLAKVSLSAAPGDLDEIEEDKLSELLRKAEGAVLKAKPRTLAGLAAQLIFAADFWAYDDPGNFLVPFLVNAARTIDAPLVSKIGFSKHVAECLSDDEEDA